MRAADHLEMAERSLSAAQSAERGGQPHTQRNHLLTAIAHALIGHAVEAGVPHATGQAGGDGDAVSAG